jgi:spore coat protein A
MDSSRRKLLLRGAQLMATAAAGQSGLLGNLSLLAQQNAPPPKPGSMPGMVYDDPAPAPAQPSGPPRPWLHPEQLAKFVDPLPIPQALRSTETRPHPHQPGTQIPYHRIAMRQRRGQGPSRFAATSLWSYGNAAASSHKPHNRSPQRPALLIEWANNLPTEHFLPIDHTLCGAGKDLPKVRTAVHVHGACVPPESDGYPEDWQKPARAAQPSIP